MSALSEASNLVQRVAGPREVSDSIKKAIGRAAERLGFGYSRTKDIWYLDARTIHAHEMDRLRAEAARVEIEAAIAAVLALRQGLAKTDPVLHGQAIDALDSALCSLGAPVGAVGLREE